MKIHEYQGKELLRKFGVVVPRGVFCQSVDEAVKAAESLGGKVWVVKAQIHAGGRGKGGGVKLARSFDELRQHANAILGMQLVTHQTGPEGQKVRRLLIEEGADIKKEYYVAVLTDRGSQKVAVMASSEGGMEIEEVAHDTPEKILTEFVDPADGLTDAQAKKLVVGIGIPGRVGRACRGGAQGALRLLHGNRRFARRNQPADSRRRRHDQGARRQVQLRRQRPLSHPRHLRLPRSRRGRFQRN